MPVNSALNVESANMKKSRPVPWRKGIQVAVVLIGSGMLMWWTEARFFGNRNPIVQTYGLIAMVAGLGAALVLVTYLWWKERREQDELDNKYGSNDDNNI